MSPASAFAPYAVPCGPRSTSMRSTSDERRRHADAGEIDAVDEKSHRRIRRALPLRQLADAAQLEEARSRGARRPVEIGHEPEHILEVLHARDFERVRSRARWRSPADRSALRSRSSAVTTTSSSDESSATAASETKRVTNKNGIAHAARNEECIPIPPPVLAGSGSTGSRPIRISGRCSAHWPPRGEADSSRKLLLE